MAKVFILNLLFLCCSLSPAVAEVFKDKSGRFTFRSEIGDERIRQAVYYAIPKEIDAETRVVIVMHGMNRNADDYRDAWERHTHDKNLLVIVPEFSKRTFPGSSGYNLAGILDERGSFRGRDEWAFNLIDELFRYVKEEENLQAERFFLYGHSAGAQFVHRYVMFSDSENFGLGVAANAGWYTMPDSSVKFPYGVGGMPEPFQVEKALLRKLFILLGENDTDTRSSSLNDSEEASRQGAHRFLRGQNFFETARRLSASKNVAFSWHVRPVPGVGHSNSGMSDAAAEIIVNADLE